MPYHKLLQLSYFLVYVLLVGTHPVYRVEYYSMITETTMLDSAHRSNVLLE